MHWLAACCQPCMGKPSGRQLSGGRQSLSRSHATSPAFGGKPQGLRPCPPATEGGLFVENRLYFKQHLNNLESESVKCRFSKCRFSVLNVKFDFISDGGCTREKQIQKALGSLPPCRNRCRFSESAICSSRVHPPSEKKSNFKFKTLRWRPLRWRLTLSDRR